MKRDYSILDRTYIDKRTRKYIDTGMFDVVSDITNRVSQLETKGLMILDSCKLIEEFINKCESNGDVAINVKLSMDSEEIVGVSLFTDGFTPSYISLNHMCINELTLCKQNIPKQIFNSVMERLSDSNVKVYVHDKSKFVMQSNKFNVLKNADIHWDSLIASKLLNENEEQTDFYSLCSKYLNENFENSQRSIEDRIDIQLIDAETACKLFGNEAYMIYSLKKFQYDFLSEDGKYIDMKDLRRVSKVYTDIELPFASVIANMETEGMFYDVDHADSLRVAYEFKANKARDSIFDIVKPLLEISETEYDEINIDSSSQLADLLYDIMKFPQVDGRSTSVTTLEKMIDRGFDGSEFLEWVISYKVNTKVLSSFLNKLPEYVQQDGKIHANFNQLGAVTGRIISSNPNIQGIPKSNFDVRQSFNAGEGRYFITADYSAQELRIVASMSGDDKLKEAFFNGYDVYSEIADDIFDEEYESKHSISLEPKQKRSIAKQIVLAILYGEHIGTLAKQLSMSINQAKELHSSIMNKYTGLRQFVEDSIDFCKEKGFVESIYGRKRRLPDIQLEESAENMNLINRATRQCVNARVQG